MRLLLLFIYIALSLSTSAQIQVTENRQHHFPNDIPAGDYSGIAWLGSNRYAVVSDKSANDGFFVFQIDIDSISGEILSARDLGFHSSGFANRDQEDIAYIPETDKLLIVGEAGNRILEYNIDGIRTLREVQLPARYQHLPPNLGLEALTYNPKTRTLWTCNETDSIFIQQMDSLFMPQATFHYSLDAPKGDVSKAQFYAHGVGTLCALDDGTLLVLEREFYVPKAKLGAFVSCKLYHFYPNLLKKELVSSWTTKLSLFGRSLANYEGMCLGPTLVDGSRVIILVADSQHQYGGVLKDWLKTLKITTSSK
ncbi:MAG: esterase-like activity of phytase family protein [Bacteroidota bacterium]|nr:esterase-like activity of phytase family protein [Bacteroidota bacterium]